MKNQIRIDGVYDRRTLLALKKLGINHFRFDICIEAIKVLLEINGTIFHADPRIYKENDILPLTKRIAKDIWEKDKRKREFAQLKNYSLIEIWELDIKKCTERELTNLVLEKIHEAIKDKKYKETKSKD
jgi:hypothetical protein